MTTSLVLAIYLLIGLLYAHQKYNHLVSEFEEELDENDPEEREIVDARNQLYDQLHNLSKMIGDKNLKTVLYLCFMLFWLPIIIFAKLNSVRK